MQVGHCWLLLFLWVAACADVTPTVLDQAGDPCRLHISHHTCVDDDSALRCEASIWTVTSCESICTELGPAYVAEGCEEQCVCVLADPSGCVPGELTCMDEVSIGLCSPTQTWEVSACDDLCAASQLESLGCLDAACWCTAEGTACDVTTPPACVDESTIASCTGGTWVFEDCSTVCGGPALCDAWLMTAACAC